MAQPVDQRCLLTSPVDQIATVGDLIAALDRYDPATPVRLATQPGHPIEHTPGQVVCTPNDAEGDADILAPPTTPPTTPSRHVLDAVSALLATCYGGNGERRIDPDDIDWAKTYGGALHVIEHADGSVTFTKEHRDDCPFITSSGMQDCDDECVFEHPANAKRQLGR